jgi:hypothetical protein
VSKDALIEAMARSRMSRNTNMTWDDAGEVTKEWMCDVVAPDADVVVAFVAEWLDDRVCVVPDGRGGADRASRQWREEMGA